MDPSAPRSSNVDVTLRDGRTVSHFTRHAPGSKETPVDTDGVTSKARSLIEPVMGPAKPAALIQRVNALEDVKSVRELMSLLAG